MGLTVTFLACFVACFFQVIPSFDINEMLPSVKSLDEEVAGRELEMLSLTLCKLLKRVIHVKERSALEDIGLKNYFHPYYKEAQALAIKHEQILCRIESSMDHMREVVSKASSKRRAFLDTLVTFLEANLRIPDIDCSGYQRYEEKENTHEPTSSLRGLSTHVKARFWGISITDIVPAIVKAGRKIVHHMKETAKVVGRKVVKVVKAVKTVAKKVAKRVEKIATTVVHAVKTVAEQMEEDFVTLYNAVSEGVRKSFNIIKNIGKRYMTWLVKMGKGALLNITAYIWNLEITDIVERGNEAIDFLKKHHIVDLMKKLKHFLEWITKSFLGRFAKTFAGTVTWVIEAARFALDFIIGFITGYGIKNYTLCTGFTDFCDSMEGTVEGGIGNVIPELIKVAHTFVDLVEGNTDAEHWWTSLLFSAIEIIHSLINEWTMADDVVSVFAKIGGEMAGGFVRYLAQKNAKYDCDFEYIPLDAPTTPGTYG